MEKVDKSTVSYVMKRTIPAINKKGGGRRNKNWEHGHNVKLE
jgi:hypothetical protein